MKRWKKPFALDGLTALPTNVMQKAGTSFFLSANQKATGAN